MFKEQKNYRVGIDINGIKLNFIMQMTYDEYSHIFFSRDQQ